MLPTDQEFDFVSMRETVEGTGSIVSKLPKYWGEHSFQFKVTASWDSGSQSSQLQSPDICDRAMREWWSFYIAFYLH